MRIKFSDMYMATIFLVKMVSLDFAFFYCLLYMYMS